LFHSGRPVATVCPSNTERERERAKGQPARTLGLELGGGGGEQTKSTTLLQRLAETTAPPCGISASLQPGRHRQLAGTTSTTCCWACSPPSAVSGVWQAGWQARSAGKQQKEPRKGTLAP